MAITDELRLFAADPYTGWVPTDKQQADLRAIADRIDAEHESACAEAYGNGVMSVPIALDESAWVKLPVDADGVPIHIGDMVEDASVREIIEQVMQIRYTLATSSKAPTVLTSIITDASQLPQKSSDYRHYRAPTVEDVLREFAEKITDSQIPNVHPTYEEAIAEYAAKLRLAGEE